MGNAEEGKTEWEGKADWAKQGWQGLQNWISDSCPGPSEKVSFSFVKFNFWTPAGGDPFQRPKTVIKGSTRKGQNQPAQPPLDRGPRREHML